MVLLCMLIGLNLVLNLKKSLIIFFYKKLTIDSIGVPQMSTTTLLGVFVDESLSWREQDD